VTATARSTSVSLGRASFRDVRNTDMVSTCMFLIVIVYRVLSGYPSLSVERPVVLLHGRGNFLCLRIVVESGIDGPSITLSGGSFIYGCQDSCMQLSVGVGG